MSENAAVVVHSWVGLGLTGRVRRGRASVLAGPGGRVGGGRPGIVPARSGNLRRLQGRPDPASARPDAQDLIREQLRAHPRHGRVAPVRRVRRQP